jgi:hypothetical protein
MGFRGIVTATTEALGIATPAQFCGGGQPLAVECAAAISRSRK